MKKIVSLFSLFTVVVFFTTFNVTPSFAAEGSITNLTGLVKDGNGNAVSGVNITATCNGINHSTTTVANGSYQILFSTADNCITGDTVSVTGTKGSNSGGGSAQVHLQKNLGVVFLNFSVINFSVPEFSTMLGLVAGLTSLGGYFALRKRTA